MSHSSGTRPGNHRDGFSQVPEPIRGEAAPVLLTLDFCRKGAGLLIQSEFTGVGLSVQKTRSTTLTVCRRSVHSIPKYPASSAPKPENGNGGPPPVLHSPTLQNVRGQCLQFQSFDESYLSRLRSGDFRTQENFSSYFSALIKIKLGSRLKSPEAVEDVRQETFARFFVALRDGKIHQPDRLGSFVNSICNNVLLEHYRASARNTSLDDEEEKNFPVLNVDFLGGLSAKE